MQEYLFVSLCKSSQRVFSRTLLFYLLLTLGGFSPQPCPAMENSERELVQNLSFYSHILDLQVSFSQVKTIKDLQVQLHSEGNMHFQAPNHLVWKITKPSPVSVTFDGGKMRIETGDGIHAPVQTLETDNQSAEDGNKSLAALSSWLSLDVQRIAKENDIKKLSTRHFKFIPKKIAGQKNAFADLEMTIGKTGHLEHLILHELSGDTLDLKFGKPNVIKKPKTSGTETKK